MGVFGMKILLFQGRPAGALGPRPRSAERSERERSPNEEINREHIFEFARARARPRSSITQCARYTLLNHADTRAGTSANIIWSVGRSKVCASSGVGQHLLLLCIIDEPFEQGAPNSRVLAVS